MVLDQIIVIVVLILVIVALIREIHRPGIILISALFLFVATGIIDTGQAISGFSNQGVLIIALLFMVSEGVKNSGILNGISKWFLPKKVVAHRRMYLSILTPIGVISSILNNTPIVLIFAPLVKSWSERLRMDPGQFLMPLSFITILGGSLTIIGTSTNLLVHGLLLENQMEGLGFFETGKVGIFIFAAGLLYLVLFSRRILQKFRNEEDFQPEKEFFLEAMLDTEYWGEDYTYGRLKEEPLKDVNLTAVFRDGQYIQDFSLLRISEGDKLLLNASLHMLEHLRSVRGIVLHKVEEAYTHHKNGKLETVEAILSARFPGVGKRLSEVDFLNRYNSVVMAIYRNGDQVYQEMDQVRLKEGDTLLLLTDESFVHSWNDSQVFHLLTHKGDIQFNVNRTKALLTYSLLVFLLAGAIVTTSVEKIMDMGFTPLLIAGFVMTLMVWFDILPSQRYTKSVNWDILITIASSIGISYAIHSSGLSDTIAGFILNHMMFLGPLGLLFIVYLLTTIVTEVVTNNAAAALLFPVAISISSLSGYDPRPFIIAICIAATCSFISPIGYQTNMIVQSIGHYKYRDFSRLGLPLSLLVMLMSVFLIPLFWPF